MVQEDEGWCVGVGGCGNGANLRTTKADGDDGCAAGRVSCGRKGGGEGWD